MAVFDAREAELVNIDSIVFNEADCDGFTLRYKLIPFDDDTVKIVDNYNYIFIFNKQHALNLIKALNKAIDLGWLK